MENSALVNAMNREMDRNESLRGFLLSMHQTLIKTGKAVPRKILVGSGISKRDLNKLVRIGFLEEVYLRHERQKALYTCVKLPENIVFYGNQAVAVKQEA